MFGRIKPRAADLSRPLNTVLAPGVRQIVANLIVGNDGKVWAGYRIGPSRWDYTPVAQRAALIERSADTWADLAGRDARERVTTRPHPIAAWARDLDRRTPVPAPDVPGETWNDHLVRMQQRVGSAGMEDKIVFRQFTIGTVERALDVRSQVQAVARTGILPSDEVRALLAEEDRVWHAVQGWGATRMTEREQGWLRERSTAPGMPAPLRAVRDGWDASDLPELANDVRWHEQPFDRTVEVTGWRDGVKMVRHVQVLSATRLSDLTYPENGLEPWQTYAERLVDADGAPFAVEWSLAGRLRLGEELSRQAALDLNKAGNINETYRLFHERPPEYTERGIAVAEEERDLITTGQARDSVRFVGTISAVIVGEARYDKNGNQTKSAEQSAEERAAAFRRLYGGTGLRMDFTAPPAQAQRLRETIPGEVYDTTGYQRVIRLAYLASGMPNASTAVGDGRGPYLGYTLGAARRPVMHDPHYATEGRGDLGRGQNFWIVAATLGGGKSVLLDSIAYNEARRGITTVAVDPSGPMMALCEMPELKAVSRAINLLEGTSGELSPPSLIRPGEGWSGSGPDGAESTRRALTVDMARRCLQPDLYDHPGTFTVLREAAQDVTWTPRASMWNLIRSLEAHPDDHARKVARGLRDAADMPLMHLMFPPEGQEGDFVAVPKASLLTVISTPGIVRAIDGMTRADWSAEEHGADPILRLTALYADRLLFNKPRSQRATVIYDEAESMTDSAIGRSYFSRLGRDHSKWNLAVYLGLKNVTDEMMGGELRNFLAGAFVGKMANEEPARQMLSILHIEDERYAQVLMGLSARRAGEFVHLDADGRVGGIKVDVDYHPALKAAALTNPTPAGSEGWAYEEDGALV